MKTPILKLIVAVPGLFLFSQLQGQLADVTYTTRTASVNSYENATFGACWESGTEEYAAYVGAWDNVNGAVSSTGCQTCSNNGNCNYAFNVNLHTRSNNAYSILSNIDAWENDCSSNCSYNSCGLFNSLSDDCRRQQTASYNFRETGFPSNGTYNNGPSWGSTNDHVWTLSTTWKYSGSASLLTPSCAVQTASYTASAIRSWSVNLVAGISYNFNTCASPSSDTYLRLYGPDGYSIVGFGDDNCGVLSIINYTAAATGTYYLEVSQYSRGPLTQSGILSYSITTLPSNNACANAIAIGPGSTTTFNTTCATQDAPPQNCGAGTQNDIWYTFTPSSSGNMTVANCSQNAYDSRISVYTGTCGALIIAGCNDDACGSSSSLALTVCKNVTYYISVGGDNAQMGAGTLNLSFTSANALPVITCPANISVNAFGGTCAAPVTYSVPVGTDNCPGFSTAHLSGPGSGASYPVGTTSNTYLVTDSDGATAQCSFTITVIDNQNPSITCPANISVNAAPGLCSAVIGSLGTPATADNCNVASVTNNHPSSTYTVGTANVLWTVTDGGGRTSTCTQTVTVIDNQLPTITCPAALTVPADPGQCSAIIASLGSPAAADNCAVSSLNNNHASSTYPVGSTTVVWTVSDPAGGNAACSQVVTVSDLQDPVLSCPANISVNADPGLCTAIVASLGNASATDNCAVSSVSNNQVSTTYSTGTAIVTWTATDVNGRTGTCAQSVTVVDNQAPAITCPANFAGSNDPGQCSKVVSFTTPIGSDNCTSTTSQTAGLASGSAFPVGNTTNTFSVTDASGNTSSCSFSVLISDTELPAISCPANISANTGTGVCDATVSYAAPAGTDNCASVTAQTAGLASGSSYPVGTTIHTFSVSDAAGNTASCTFSIVVADNELPAIVCPANISLSASPGLCSAPATYGTPLGTDNCTPSTAQTSGLASGALFPVGTTSNTFVVSDGSGNTASCSFDVIVTDNEAPVISCPANISSFNDLGQCARIVNFSVPLGTDNCTPITTQTSGLPSGSAFPVGTTLNTFSVADGSGNTANCSFSIVITDNEQPALVCPPSISVSAAVNSCDAIVSWAAPSPSDNCNLASNTATAAPGSTFNPGSTTVTYTVLDSAGNSNTCSFTVTVTDSVAPVAACQDLTLNLDSSGNASTNAAAIDNGSSDNCNLSSIQINQSSFSCADAGTNTVTLTATDANGNTSTCTSVVTIVAPALVSSVSVDTFACGYHVSCAGGNDGVAHAIVGTGCPGFTYLWSNGATTSSVSGLAAGTYSVTITDASGASQVHVVSLSAPSTALGATVVTSSSCSDAQTGSIDLTPFGGSDCQGYTYLWSNGASSQDLSGLAPGTYSVTVTDAGGCTHIQSATVGVFAPLIATISQSGNTLSSVQTWASYQWLFNGNPIPGATSNIHVATQNGSYSLVVTDGNGCSTTTSGILVSLVGIADAMGSLLELSIYPNPANGEFRLRAESPIGFGITVQLHDMYGHVLLARTLPELGYETAFDIRQLAAGTYIVEVTAAYGQRRMFRLVVQ